MSIYPDNNLSLILASKSPRRQQLLADLGFKYTVLTKETDETYPDNIPIEEVSVYLAIKKATALLEEIDNEIIIASDTVVLHRDVILGKPNNELEAFEMLSRLSDETHKVITGVCLLSKNKKTSFKDTTLVTFDKITKNDINYYINQFQPFDKAGSYGIQEWLGMIAITKIVGSYFNVGITYAQTL